MTLLSHSLLDQGSELWQWGFDDLEYAGVNLFADQMAAFTTSSQAYIVMVAWALPDPRMVLWWDGDVAPFPPMETCETPGGRTRRPTTPAVFEVDWGAIPDVEAVYGPLWRRFPSLPGRVVLPDGSYESEELPRYIRCWDQCAIDTDLADSVAESLKPMWQYSNYSAVRDWWMVNEGHYNLCDLADFYARPRKLHQHRIPSGWPEVDIEEDVHNFYGAAAGCLDGEALYTDLAKDLFHCSDPDLGYKPLAMEYSLIEPALLERWETLTATSQQHAEQALLVSPSEIDALRVDELRGGRPWG